MKSVFKVCLEIAVFLSLFYLLWPKEKSCSESVAQFRKERFYLVITELEPAGKEFIASGYHPIDKSKTKYRPTGGSWYSYLYKQLIIGDTLQKQVGANSFLIRRKNYNLLVPYTCGEDSFAIATPVVKKIPK